MSDTKQIEISESTYSELGRLAQPFEQPDAVIQRLIQFFYAQSSSQGDSSEFGKEGAKHNESARKQQAYVHGKLEINFYPEDLVQFKALLLKEKNAWVKLFYSDGSAQIHQWTAYRFTERSDVLGNLRSGYLRSWREKGVIRADVAINQEDLG